MGNRGQGFLMYSGRGISVRRDETMREEREREEDEGALGKGSRRAGCSWDKGRNGPTYLYARL